MHKDPRQGRGRGAMNFKAYDTEYKRAFYSCSNTNCSKRYDCYRFLRTPTIEKNSECFVPMESGECEWYIPCHTKKDFDKLER